MLIDQEVEVTLARSIKHYIALGYVIPEEKQDGEKFRRMFVSATDLPVRSAVRVQVLCDYCLEEGIENIYSVKYCEYTQSREVVQKDACFNCRVKKQIDVTMSKYGVRSTALIPEIKEKQRQSLYKRYGVDNAQKSKEIQLKTKQTNIEKYGVPYVGSVPEFQKKQKETMIERYGVEKTSQLPDYHEKIKKQNQEKYGVDYFFETDEFKTISKATNEERYGTYNAAASDEIKEKIADTNMKKYGAKSFVETELFKEVMTTRYGVDNPSHSDILRKKITNTRYKNGKCASSKQQRYLCKLFCSELNYPIKNYNVDIAMLKDRIYMEYDGGGHSLGVLRGDISEEEFRLKEIKRYYIIKNENWKMIRIISSIDKLPDDECLLSMYAVAKQYFLTGGNWIKFDIDLGTVEWLNNIMNYDYGELRKIVE